MRARKYDRRVQIFQTQKVSDGFGGHKTSNTLIAESWAEVRTAASTSALSQRLTEFGVTDPTLGVIFKMRFRNDIPYTAVNQYIRYRGQDYIIQNAIINEGLDNIEVELITVRQSSKGSERLLPVGNTSFTYTFDFPLA